MLKVFCTVFIFCSALVAENNLSEHGGYAGGGGFTEGGFTKGAGQKISLSDKKALTDNLVNCIGSLKKISDMGDVELEIDPSSKEGVWPVFTKIQNDIVTVTTPSGTTKITGRKCQSSKKPTSMKMISDLISESPENLDQHLKGSKVSSNKKISGKTGEYLKILKEQCSKTSIKDINRSARIAVEEISSRVGPGYHPVHKKNRSVIN